MLFYIDGQSIGNEQKGQPRKARIAIVYQPSSSLPSDLSDSRVLVENLGDKTNNEAEYHALIRLLSLLSLRRGQRNKTISEETETIRILSDSKLLVKQVSGEWKIEEERLNKLREEARGLMDRLDSITLEWIPREKNLAGLWLEGKWSARKAKPEQFLSERSD